MKLRRLCALVFPAALALAASPAAHACAVCFGRTDSPLGKGLHWGVAALLAVIFMVLAAFGAFAIYLVRRAASVDSDADAPPPDTRA